MTRSAPGRPLPTLTASESSHRYSSESSHPEPAVSCEQGRGSYAAAASRAPRQREAVGDPLESRRGQRCVVAWRHEKAIARAGDGQMMSIETYQHT